jgi:transposase
METGPLAVWHWHELRAAGVPVVCLHARQAAAALKLQANKTDDNDAFGLAQLVRSGWFRPVQVKSLKSHRLRAVLTARAKLVDIRTALTNTIRGLCKTFGVVLGPGRNSSFWADALRARAGWKKARVGLARKLAVLLYRLWIDGTAFRQLSVVQG